MDVEEQSHGGADDRGAEAVGGRRKAENVAREVGVSKHTIYAWKTKYGGMYVSEAQEAKQLRDENTRLKNLKAQSEGEIICATKGAGGRSCS